MAPWTGIEQEHLGAFEKGMRSPDWTVFRAADGTDPTGACCLLEKTFDLSNLPRNYIWCIGYLGQWPEHPEQAEISAQVKSYSRQWLIERSEIIKQKQKEVEAKRIEMEELALQRKIEDEKIAMAKVNDVAEIKRKIEASPLDMAKGLIKSAKDLAAGGVTDPKARMDVCNTCPFKGKDQRCGKCGCFLPAKTRIAKSSCPIGLW